MPDMFNCGTIHYKVETRVIYCIISGTTVEHARESSNSNHERLRVFMMN